MKPLSEKRKWFLKDMDDYSSGENGYYENALKEAINGFRNDWYNVNLSDLAFEELLIKHFGKELCEL